MRLDKMSKEELEQLSYKDITHMILTEEGGQNTAEIFQRIVDLLSLPHSVFETKIGDFYTSLTTDKRFVLIDGVWDLRSRHTSDKVVIKVDEEEEEIDDLKDDVEEETDEVEEPFVAADDDDDYDDSDDELKDLVVIDEEETDIENN